MQAQHERYEQFPSPLVLNDNHIMVQFIQCLPLPIVLTPPAASFACQTQLL